ncbi:MAG TPA: protocatechuate 3,4-dioxygenase [Blastocatellia bacterium]|nr:protocatechuate 3,4-dioxygenase [Blastocatellia bacterium]
MKNARPVSNLPEQTEFTGRRTFLKYLSLSAAVPVLPLVSVACQKYNQVAENKDDYKLPRTPDHRAICASCATPASLSSKVTIASASEPGDRMVISGTIYQPDGVTPADGIVLFVYHTDATGYYNKQDDPFSPRLRAWLRTGADGKYEFQTIKPGPYPHFATPAHIHASLWGPGYPEYGIDEYWFEGDPRINATERAKLPGRGGYNNVISLKLDGGGVLRGARDIKVERV